MILIAILAGVVLLFFLSWIVLGLVFKLLWWAIVGLAIGALARLVMPGRQAIGLLGTAAAGVGGALLGGIIAHAIGVGALFQLVIAVAVAAALVALLAGSERRYV